MDEKKVILDNKVMISSFIQQVLELIDDGKSITVEEASDALNKRKVYFILKEKFDLPLLSLVDTYDYNLIDRKCTFLTPDKTVESFKNNGLLTIVNYYQWLLENYL